MHVTQDRIGCGNNPFLTGAGPFAQPLFDIDAIGPDPLGDDLLADQPVLTTDRRLRRIVAVAADVGARFVREGLTGDPAAWMQAPRGLFGGRTAIEACQDRDSFVRATLLHGLSFGMDAEPEELDAVLIEDPWDDAPEEELGAPAWRYLDAVSEAPRLFTCLVAGRIGSGGRSVEALCAMVVADEGAARRRLRCRYGQDLGDRAEVVEGTAAEHPLARRLLSDDMAGLIAEMARDPGADAACGFDVQLERRFAA